MISNTQVSHRPIQMSEQHSDDSIDCQQKRKIRKIGNPYIKWTRQQDVLYIRFIKSNIERMKKTHFRKPYNKFKKMSQYVTSKDSFQCRSHHQKMIKKFGSIEAIVQNVSFITSKFCKRDKNITRTDMLSQVDRSDQKISKSPYEQKLNKNNQAIKMENLALQIKTPKFQHKETPSYEKFSPLNQGVVRHSQEQFNKKTNQQENFFFYKKKAQQNEKTDKTYAEQKQVSWAQSHQQLQEMNHQREKINNKGEQCKQSKVQNNLTNNPNCFDPPFAYDFNLACYWQNMMQMNQYMNWLRFNPQQNLINSPNNAIMNQSIRLQSISNHLNSYQGQVNHPLFASKINEKPLKQN